MLRPPILTLTLTSDLSSAISCLISAEKSFWAEVISWPMLGSTSVSTSAAGRRAGACSLMSRTLPSRGRVNAVACPQEYGGQQRGQHGGTEDGCLGDVRLGSREGQLGHEQGDREAHTGQHGDADQVAPLE